MDSNFRLDDYMLEHRNEVLALDHELGHWRSSPVGAPARPSRLGKSE
jgi:hypothetical protein